MCSDFSALTMDINAWLRAGDLVCQRTTLAGIGGESVPGPDHCRPHVLNVREFSVAARLGFQGTERVFHRGQLRAVWREMHGRDILRNDQVLGPVPTIIIVNHRAAPVGATAAEVSAR